MEVAATAEGQQTSVVPPSSWSSAKSLVCPSSRSWTDLIGIFNVKPQSYCVLERERKKAWHAGRLGMNPNHVSTWFLCFLILKEDQF